MSADDNLNAAAKHASNAAGMLNSMCVGVGRGLNRLRETKRLLDEAAQQVDAAITAIEMRKT